jgi:hypothetical protein
MGVDLSPAADPAAEVRLGRVLIDAAKAERPISGPSGYGAEATPDLSVGNDPTGEVQVQDSFGFKGPLQVHGIVVTIEANSGAAYRHWPAIKPWVKLVPATAEFGTVNPPLARVGLLSRGAFLQRRCAVRVETHEVWSVRRHISVAQRLPQQRSFHVLTRQQVYRGDRGIRTDVSNTRCDSISHMRRPIWGSLTHGQRSRSISTVCTTTRS